MTGGREEHTFAWFPKFTETLMVLEGADFERIAKAVMRFGTYGEEPELSTPFERMYFGMVREAVENSIRSRERNRGGRPRKEAPETENPRENPRFEDGNPRFEGDNGGSDPRNPNHTKPFHTNTNQTKPRGVAGDGGKPKTPTDANERQRGKPTCPLCGVRMFRNGQIAKWQCPNCNDTFTDEKLKELKQQ